MARSLEDTASVGELEVIAAAMREAFSARSPGPHEADLERVRSLTHAFPGYEIVREIHRGGQGVVYQALQKSTQRQVAIKVMRDGPFADASDRTRFEREVQVLAQLDHPNVVSIHDSGVAHDRFYYVMDYILGRPLDEYVADEEPSIEDLLRLFQTIADAVNAAHLRGVTHRDLKPSNILVVNGKVESRRAGTKSQKVEDGSAIHSSLITHHSLLSAQPKILDFGLAKLAPLAGSSSAGAADDAAATLPVMTISGQFVGSLPWASPEQAEGSPSKIDLRTDVYSLGVILYQLLTGRFPYSVVGTMRDVVDQILTAEPARPTTLRRGVNDEIETIVLKCLSKERERRYQSAGELARDIGRYLAGEPIEAKRDSGWYVMRKTLGRYKAPVAVAGAFLALLVFGAVVLSVMYRQAASAERETRQTADFVHAMINSDLMRKMMLGKASAQEVLDDFARQIENEHPPAAVEASCRHAVGSAFSTVGLYKAAESQLRAALVIRRQLYPQGHADLVTSLNSVGECLKDDSRAAEAAELHEEALAMARGLWGEEHREVATSLHHLASARWYLNQYETARPLYEEALAMRRRLLGDEDPESNRTLMYLAACLDKLGDHLQAERLYRQSLDMCRRHWGAEHSEVADNLNNLATCLYEQARFAEAEPLFRQALAMSRDEVGDRHPHVPRMLHNLGKCLREMGDHVQAGALLDEALAKKTERLGKDHLSTAKTIYELARLRLAEGNLAEAKRLGLEAKAIQDAHQHPDSEASQALLDQIAVGD